VLVSILKFGLNYQITNDIIGTGTGKTLAFALPLVEKLLKNKSNYVKNPKALILTPTRELAIQVEKEVTMVANSQLKTLCVYGGSSYTPQVNALRRGVDIIVGTPGRVQDLFDKGELSFKDVETLILDEADHMLDIGFAKDLESLIHGIKNSKKGLDTEDSEHPFQFLLFSATVPEWVHKTVRTYLKSDYVKVDLIGNDTLKASASVTQLSIATPRKFSSEVICNLLSTKLSKNGRAIIFAERKSDCDALCTSVQNSSSVVAAVLHGDVTQQAREQSLLRFRSGKIQCLIATDVAARGLDIPNVELVIQSELPKNPETFIHRSGRTGRANNVGTCVTLFDPTTGDVSAIRNIERVAGFNFERVAVPSVESSLQKSIPSFLEELSKIPRSTFSKVEAAVAIELEKLSSPLLSTSSKAITAALIHNMSQMTSIRLPSLSLMDGRPHMKTFIAECKDSKELASYIYQDLGIDHRVLELKNITPTKGNTQMVFDVREREAEVLIEAIKEKDEVVKECLTLPSLIQVNQDRKKLIKRGTKNVTSGTEYLLSKYKSSGNRNDRGGRNDRNRNYGNDRNNRSYSNDRNDKSRNYGKRY
jgi:superfamily II DNA/RNA helicase